MTKAWKVWLVCLIGFCTTGAFIAKLEIRNSTFASAEGIQNSGHLERDIKLLYESGKCGRVTFVPGSGHRIQWHQPGQKKQCFAQSGKKPAVTYGLSGGRLGDNLLSYLHARWIAYRDHVPLVCKHFPMDDEFALAYEPAPVVEKSIEEIPYFPESSMKNQNPPFFVDWDDPGFCKEIAQCLAPTKQHTLLELPTERITVCVHVRRGGTFDPPSLWSEYPLKFPPDSYYIEQIRTIARLFQGKPLYLFLMTDDLNPEALIHCFQRAVPYSNIQWDCRKKPLENDLDDFFSIPRFDCLILCDSNFSIVASKLAEYAIRIAPTHYIKKKGNVRIIGLDIAFNPAYKKVDPREDKKKSTEKK